MSLIKAGMGAHDHNQADKEGTVETARAPSWRFRAVGAAFSVKDRLKGRGYRWDVEAREWRREVRDADRMGEEWWLAANVYAAEAWPKALAPIVERVTWRERHA